MVRRKALLFYFNCLLLEIHNSLANKLLSICNNLQIFAHVIYVGRLNEMKLGNFADLGAFIHIACPGKPLFDFHRPVISPFEFICAHFKYACFFRTLKFIKF